MYVCVCVYAQSNIVIVALTCHVRFICSCVCILCMYGCMYAQACMYTAQVCMYKCSDMYVYMLRYVSYDRSSSHTYIHTDIHTYTYAHACITSGKQSRSHDRSSSHTYIHTYIHTHALPRKSNLNPMTSLHHIQT